MRLESKILSEMYGPARSGFTAEEQADLQLMNRPLYSRIVAVLLLKSKQIYS